MLETFNLNRYGRPPIAHVVRPETLKPSRASETLLAWTRRHTQFGLVHLIFGKTGVRVDQSTVSDWVRGEKIPIGIHLLALQQVLKIPLADWYRPPKNPWIEEPPRVRRSTAELIAAGAGKPGAKARAEAAAKAKAAADKRAEKRATKAKAAETVKRAPARKGPVKTKTTRGRDDAQGDRSPSKRRTGSD